MFRFFFGRNDKKMIITYLKWLNKIVDFACFSIYGINQTTQCS